MRRAARALLVAAALWPGLTLGLQRAFDVDPWKLMSFGMYATPARRPADLQVSLWVLRAGAWSQVAPGSLQPEVDSFKVRRQALGELSSPEPLARRLLQREQAQAARVELRGPRLDPATARVRVRQWSAEVAASQ